MGATYLLTQLKKLRSFILMILQTNVPFVKLRETLLHLFLIMFDLEQMLSTKRS